MDELKENKKKKKTNIVLFRKGGTVVNVVRPFSRRSCYGQVE